jgi:hypothetical protein
MEVSSHRLAVLSGMQVVQDQVMRHAIHPSRADAIAPLFLLALIFSDHPKLRLDLSDAPRDAVKAHFLVHIMPLNLSQRKQALNMF